MTTINRKHKDRLFRLIFADEKNKANTLSLYNALNNSSYENEEDLEITTIEDVLYIRMKNDLSFVIADTMNLYEQQSTHNPNMPLRGFLYFASLYEKYLDTHELSLHVKTPVKVPTPNYIVFYNGTDARPAMEKLRLSDAFQIPDDRGEFEWTATVINLNHAGNHNLLKRCKPLSDYTFLVSRIQGYQKTMTTTEAVNKAVDDCIQADVLASFLRAHRAEVLRVYLAEVNEEVLRKNLRAEGYGEGYDDGYDSGYDSGISTGDQNRLILQITKKIKAGKPLEQIASEDEENAEDIREMYERIAEELHIKQ